MQHGSPLDVIALGPAACAARLWRGPAGRHLTVIVKARVELVPGASAAVLTDDVEIIPKDAHYLGSPGRSVEQAAELAPYLARCDVTLRGHAFAPRGQPVAASAVRLAVYRAAPLLDKRLFVYGDPDPAGGADARLPFQQMPLDYEHAFGGKTNASNPVGRGADAKGSGARPPNVVDATDPTRPGSFAPLSRFWADRGRLLGSTSRKSVDDDDPQLPQGFDWRYYQAAPADQQVPYLTGDEWIVLDGMHPALPRVQSQLPSMRGAAAVYAFANGAYGPARAVSLSADMLAIDADELVASIVWRGSIQLEADVDVAQLKVIGGVEVAGSRIPWPDPRTMDPPRGATPPAPAPAIDPSGTVMQTPEEAARAAQQKASPFVAAGAHAFVPPPSTPAAPSVGGDTITTAAPRKAATMPFVGGPRSSNDPPSNETPTLTSRPAEPPHAPPSQPAYPAPVPPPVLADVDFSATQTLPTGASPSGSAPAKALPFDPRALPSNPSISIASPSPARAPEEQSTGTITLSPEALERALKQVLPFLLTRSDRGAVSKQEQAPPAALAPGATKPPAKVPPRISPQVPIVNRTPLTAATSPWQLRPPQDSLTLVVKGTCDLVPGGRAKLREEADPLSGDVHVDDDLERSLVYPSDFAVMKPRADVIVLGSAVPTKGPVTHLRVTAKLGNGAAPQGFDRAMVVVGDRTWNRSLLGATPGDPTPFERMPLVHERAFGGPSYAQNPAGTGQGGTPLPNLEDPERPIQSAADSPPPASFAAISPLWRARASKLGSYNSEWLATRWPYFPVDFDWSHFQSAPKAQQVDHLKGDEAFELGGMHAEHGILRGSLPGVRVRAFALETEAAGGSLYEIPLRLDTVVFDVDEMKANLVWRGVFETSDDEAPEIQALFVHTEALEAAPISLDDARRSMIEAATPDEDEEEDPGGSLEVPPAPSPERRREVVASLAAGESFDGADLQGAILAGLDFRGRSLAGANLKGASLQGCGFAGAKLDGAVLAGADLANADLTQASLVGADLTSANLESAKLDGANLDGADLSGVRADKASFRKARGASVQLAGGSFRGARFDGAELPSADFSEAALHQASFEDAVIPEVRLFYATGEGTRFDRARMEEARCDDALLPRCVFTRVKAPASVWEKTNLAGSVFTSASLADASFARADCEATVFHAIDAPNARFQRAKLVRAEFLKANLMEADLERADLTNADLRGANLHGAETRKAKLGGAKLELAILTGSKLKARA